MSFSINTNVASLSAQNYLRINSAFQATTINRVTSGLRIVQSGDDAAGLAIANGYRSDQAVLTQGVRNANDGMSQLQIIDGGMNNISQLLDRARTLATQSATGTFTGDRGVLNSEFQSVLGEIDRQAQSIGLDTGGIFAKNLSVFIGGGKDSGAVGAVSNGSVAVNLSQSTVDSRSLGMKGVQVSGTAGTDIGAGSGLTSLSSILSNSANKASEATPDTTTFYLKGPGFDSQGVKISVNTQNIGGTSDLVTAINSAIQAAATGGTQQGTALKNANITASVSTDSAGRTQLTFNSGVAAFQVQAGDQMSNALMGNFQPLNAAATGADTQSTLNTTAGAAQTISFQFDGNSSTTITVAGLPSGAATTKQAIADALNANGGFHAAATASLNGNQLVITSNDTKSGSGVKVMDGGAGSLSRLVGLTTNGDVSTASSSPSTGANLATSVLGSSVTGTGGTLFTAANAGNITVRFSGAGLTSPVDITVAASAGETLTSAVNDLNTQVSANSSLKAAGISLNPAYDNLDGNHQLSFNSTSGQAFNVAVTGDTTNQLGFGSFQAGNTVSGNNGAFDYTTLKGSSYAAGTTGTQGLTAGTATLQFSINGQASSTNNVAVDLTALPGATAAIVTGTQTIASPVTINAAGGVAASLATTAPVAAAVTFGAQVAAAKTLGGTIAAAVTEGGTAAAGLTFTSTNQTTAGNLVTIKFVGGVSQTLGITSVVGSAITVQLGTDGGGAVTSTAAQVMALMNGSSNTSGLVTTTDYAGGGTAFAPTTPGSFVSLAGGGSNGLTFTSTTPGVGGNAQTVSFVGGVSLTQGITSFAGGNVVIQLGTDANGNSTSTATSLQALMQASAGSLGFNTALTGGGTGFVQASGGAQNLAGGGNAALTFTAFTAGAAGNSLDVTFQHAGNNSTLGVVVTGTNHVVVNLATDSTGNITSSAANVVTLLTGGASGVTAALVSGDGSALVSNSGSPQHLTGGGDAGLTFTSKRAGTLGNSDTIQFQNTGASVGAASVATTGNAVSGYHFMVTLATDGSDNVTSTATSIATLLNTDVTASPLIQAGTVGTGSQIVTTFAQTSLAGGEVSGGNTNNQLNLTVSGHAYNVQLTSGANVSLNSIAAQINATSTFGTYGTATVQANNLVLTSTLKGAGASVQVEAGSANSLLGLTTGSTFGTSATGTDIKNYLNQQFASNQVLQQSGLQAGFAAGQLSITSNNGTNFRINEIATTAATSAEVAGSATFTTQNTAAVEQGGSGANFTFATAQTLTYTAGGTGQTVYFGIGTYSKQQVLDAINSQSTLATASLDASTGKIQLVANTAGAATSIVIGNNTSSTANTILGFSSGATATGVSSTATTAIDGTNDQVNLVVDGTAMSPITLTHGLTQAGSDVVGDLTTAFTAQHVNATASLDSGGHLQITSNTTGVNSKVQVLAGSADTILGFSPGVTAQGTDTNIGYGATGSTFTGNTTSGAPVQSAQVDAGGASQTTDMAFTPLLYGSDAQTITVVGNNSSGAQQSTSIVLQNNGSNRTGRSIDEAVSAINVQLQQSNNSTLQQIVAVKDNSKGTEQIKFMSTLGSFQVTVGSNGNVTGLGSAVPGSETNPLQQGTTFASGVAGGGSSADISNQSSAQAAVTALAKAVSTLGSAQAVIGRGENTFNYAVNLAQSQLTNLATAESRIRDADLAAEAANLTKAQILMQAGVAALAQANSAPQQVLSLLRG